ncbi:MAG: hypothetical protein K8W52_42795 [Deltaproteobacteria bacterium]|nr:hypothetical protein [Deltaproteobacteria bacterium]
MVRLGLLLVVLGACSFDKTGIGAGNDGPPGGIDAATDGPPADAACASSCVGAVLKGCGGSPDITCDLGCSTMGGAHCEVVVPSNGVGLDALTGVTGGITTTTPADPQSRHEYTIDTDTGLIQDWGTSGFPSGSPSTVRAAGTGVRNGMNFQTSASLATLAVDHLTIARDSVLYGFGTRPLAILSSGDVAIEGAIDFSAGCYDADGTTFLTSCGGAGGGAGSTNKNAGGCGAGGDGVDSHATGGGGGGYSTAGAKGGDFMGATGGAAGTSAACPGVTLEPLAGGGGGGAGSSGKGGAGGGGGGAIQITSLTRIGLTHSTGTVNDTMIYVAGAGGSGPTEANIGGGGGGAGGAILLEAPMVQIGSTAILSANGGGGGGGRQVGLVANGAYGTKTTSQAAGGAGDAVVATTGRGGAGGARLGAPAVGTGGGDGTGGGGGAVGRIRINTLAAPTLTGAVVSPDASTGALKLQ